MSAYTSNKTIDGLDALSSLDTDDKIVVGDTSDTSRAKYITKANAFSSYATLASPALTGNPTAPTQSAGDSSTKLATTAYVDRSALTIETTTGVTHSLTTTANQKVIVWAKGSMNGVMAGTTGNVILAYNTVTKDTVSCYAYIDNKIIPFALMYTETPGAGTHNITVTGSTPTDVVIIVMKIG